MGDCVELPVSRHVRFVTSFEALVSARFNGDVNAFCWPRQLAGDFSEVVSQLDTGGGVTAIDDADLLALTLSSDGAVARDLLLADQALMREAGLVPSLDCIVGYARADDDGPVATDVYSWHVDRAPVPTDTYLCTYVGQSSEAVENAMAIRRVDVPATRAALLELHGGADDADFAAFLSENCFDLHYAAKPGAQPYTFGIGNLWRIAIAYPGSPVAPCIHRAPVTAPGAAPRLLMIS